MKLKITVLFILLLNAGLHYHVTAKIFYERLGSLPVAVVRPSGAFGNSYVDEAVTNLLIPETVNPAVFQLCSHGKSDALFLNGRWRNAVDIVSFLRNNAMLSSDIKHLNIYGCEFAKGRIGKEAVQYLEDHLHVTVAASTNITGRHGDWILEAGPAIDVLYLPQYPDDLQCGGMIGGMGATDDFDGDGICNNTDIDDDNDGVLDTEEKPCLTCDQAYPFPYSRVIWQPFTGSSSVAYGSITKGGLTDSVTATTTKVFQSVDPTNFYGTGTGPYSGCQDAASSLPNSAISIYTSAYTVTYTFSKPTLNPALLFSSFDQSAVTFPQSVYVIGKQGTISGINLGSYVTSVPGTENIYSVVFPGVYTSISFTVPGNDHQGSVVLYFDKIMPAGTTTYVDLAYNSCRDEDTDGDGIPNRFDLDSDDDGCSDAYEGGATTDTNSNYIFTGPFGTNGFIDTKETATDNGIVNYISTYNQLALHKYISPCADADNDGVRNSADIDVDNDGVLNAIECPSCFYQPAELVKSIITEIQVNAHNGPNYAIDNDGSTRSVFDGAAPLSWVGLALFELEMQFPVAITSLQLDLTTWPLSTSAANTFKLQGSNNGFAWTDLSGALASTASTGTYTVTNTLPNNVYTYYRLAGVAGSNGYGGVTELRVIPTNYVSSLHPKDDIPLSVATDIDNDGILNYMDLDTDGDACPDALEAGTYNQSGVTAVAGSVQNGSGGAVNTTVSTPNSIVSGPYNGNGFADVLQSIADSNAYKYSYTYDPYAVNKTQKVCSDFDGDGVNDIVDIDDDNDGVIDAVEAPSCYYKGAEANVITNVSSQYTSASSSASLYDGAATVTYAFTGSPAAMTVGDNIFTITYAAPLNLTSLTVSDNISATTTARARLYGSIDGIVFTDVSGTDVNISTTPIVFTLNNSTTAYKYYKIQNTVTGALAAANTIGEISSIVATNYVPSLHAKNTCTTDTDNDGNTNDKDLDSDGDGCSDALESGATTNAGANYQFTGNVGTNGLDNSKETAADNNTINYISTYNQYAVFRFLAVCTDSDGDGIKDLADIDDDNDGIPDATEAPVCYKAPADANIINAVTSGLTNNGDQSDGDLQELHDGAATTNIISAGQSLTGAAIYTIQFGNAVNLTSLTLAGTTASWGTGSSAKLQASNDASAWLDLTANQLTTTGTSKIFTVTLNAGNYYYYRVTGTAGTSVAFTTTDISTVINAATYNASYYPKDTCSFDPDIDGITNDKDLDSDGDGCPDAREANVSGTLLSGNIINGLPNTSSTTANAIAAGPYGANGLANALETSAESGVVNYLSYYNSQAVYKLINPCSDFDADGINDIVDIDDDNDGVLDAIEAPSCYFSALEMTTPGSVTTESIVSSGSVGNTNDNSVLTGLVFTAGVSTTKAIFEITPNYPLKATAITVEYGSAANAMGTTANSVRIDGWNGATWSALATLTPTVAGAGFVQTFAIPAGTQNIYQKYRLYSINATLSAAPILEVKLGLQSFYNPSQYPKSTCSTDTDNDGIVNNFDLDSDGDECPDSKESGVTAIVGVTTASGIIKNGSGGAVTSNTSTVGAVISNVVSGNGFADVLQNILDTNACNYVYTYNQFGLTKTLSACLDTDGDGINNLTDIDDDNDGIPDATEAATCYYTQSEANSLINATFTSDYDFTSASLPKAHDGSIATGFVATIADAASLNAGKVLVQFSPVTTLLRADSVVVATGATALSTAAAATWILQGSVSGSVWEDLSTSVGMVAASTSYAFVNTLHPNTYYSYFRVIGNGVSSSHKAAGVMAEVNIYARNYVASVFPKPTCSVDADNDGTINTLDLDSDGDACSDAVEGNATTLTTPNYTFPAPCGANGLADTLEAGIDNGFVNYFSSYASYALDATLGPCADSDNDGIPDLVDIDDDNDGIVDAVESPLCYFSAAEAVVIKKISTGLANDDGTNVDLTGLHDGILIATGNAGTGTNVVTAGQTYAGANIYTIELPTAANLLSVSVVGATASWATASTATLKGSDDLATWSTLMSVPLSTATAQRKHLQ